MGDRGRQVQRYVEWLAATFEIEHGVDVRGNASAMKRLREIARIAREDGGPQELHVDALAEGKALTAKLTGDELDGIFEGTIPAPDVEPSRDRRKEERDEEEGSGWDSRMVAVAIISGLVFSALAAALMIHWVNERHEEHRHDSRDEKHEHH